jgi:hypothetical protein
MADVAAPTLLAVLLLLAWLRPRALDGWRRLLRRLTEPAVPAARWTAGLALAAFAAQAATTVAAGLPQPRVHDEFSYLLAADTFARGRLTNPTHPLPRPFETFHVLVQPTYASKYPPAPGLLLALGERLGHPVIGVFLGGALLAAAGAWMLAGWLPTRWARLGALLLAATFVIATSWSHSYWGGFVPATGGALLFGAAARLLRAPRARDGLALAVGLLVLAASRPWEGAVSAAVALAPFAWRLFEERGWARQLATRALPVAAVTLALGGGWLGYYQWRVTGSALTMPYQLYDARYASVPVFLWQPPRVVPPAVHPLMARFYRDFEGTEWRRQHTLAGWTRAAVAKAARPWPLYLGGALTAALAGLPWALRRVWPRWALAGVAALLASQLVILPSRPHYLAPGACLVTYLTVEGLRHLRLWRRHAQGIAWGRLAAAAIPLAVLLALPVRAAALRNDDDEWHMRRAGLQRRLLALPGRQLVIVRYGFGHDFLAEWVFDDADLRGTPVLWARGMSPAEDCALLAHERARTAWLLEVVEDQTPPRLRPYPREACAGSPAAARSSAAAPAPAVLNRTRLPSTRHDSASSRRSASG